MPTNLILSLRPGGIRKETQGSSHFNFCVVARSVLCDEAISLLARGLLRRQEQAARNDTLCFLCLIIPNAIVLKETTPFA